jgi:hypothetical protein
VVEHSKFLSTPGLSLGILDPTEYHVRKDCPFCLLCPSLQGTRGLIGSLPSTQPHMKDESKMMFSEKQERDGPRIRQISVK